MNPLPINQTQNNQTLRLTSIALKEKNTPKPKNKTKKPTVGALIKEALIKIRIK